MKTLVLLIDDEEFPMKYYRQALEMEGFQVEQIRDADTALDFAQKNRERIAVILLDCMMPPGKRYRNEDTQGGILTGVFLFADLRKQCPATPVIVLTNVAEQETLDRFEKGPRVDVVEKLDCPPLELAELAGKVAKKAGSEKPDPKDPR